MAENVMSYLSEFGPWMDEPKKRRRKATRRTAKRVKPPAKKRAKK